MAAEENVSVCFVLQDSKVWDCFKYCDFCKDKENLNSI